MANLKYGSQGDDVKKLQEALGFTGKDVDGIFGKKTQQAVREYQEKNGLAADGIAGKNTLGLLYSPKNTTPTTTPSTTPQTNGNKPTTNTGGATAPTTPSVPPVVNTLPSGNTYEAFAPSDEWYAADQKEKEVESRRPGDFTYDPYAESDIVNQAEAALQQWQAGKPGDYTPVWLDEANAYLSKYENRDPFSYDFNSDALYNQYKDQYILQGQMAMMDTMGQAAAMTGGYGNSYAQTVGQQAYNQQLNQLNEIMPELYGMAYDRYNQEGQDILNMYGIYLDKENQEYGKYQDNLNNWYKQLDYLTNDYRDKRENDYGLWKDNVDMDYGLWKDSYNTWLDEYNIASDEADKIYNRDYNLWADETGMQTEDYWKNEDRKQRDEEFAYEKDQDAKSEKNANWNKMYDLISTGNYKPTDAELKAAGMTRAEADAIAKGSVIEPKDDDSKYKDLDYESQKKWLKELDTATSAQDIQDICDRMEMEGFDPKDVAWFYNKYSTKFTNGPGGPQVDPTSYEGVKASVLQIANSEGNFMDIDIALDKAVKNGYITKEQANEIRKEAAAARQKYAQSKYTK